MIGKENFLVSASVDCSIRIWNNNEIVKILKGHTGSVCVLAVAYKDQLISRSEDRKIKVWKIESGECLRALVGHAFSVHALTISDRENLIASGSGDGR